MVIIHRDDDFSLMPPEQAPRHPSKGQVVFTTMASLLAEDARRAEEKRARDNALKTVSLTKDYCNQYNSLKSRLINERHRINGKVETGLATAPDFQGCRHDGVQLALQYEAADILMGGNGTGRWNEEQRQEICRTGKIHGYQGHHINSVADHPELQADPNNILFCTREKHLKLHRGSFRNPTTGKKINRDRMILATNTRRVAVNEVKGVMSLLPDIGFDFCMTLFCSFDRDISAKERCLTAGKTALKTSGQLAFAYLFARLCAVD